MKIKLILLGILPITAMGLGIKWIERDDIRDLAYRFESLDRGMPNPKYQLAGQVSGIGWYPGQVLSVTALTPEWIIMARHTRPTTTRDTVRFATDKGQVIDRAVDVASVVFPPLMRWSFTNQTGFVGVDSLYPDIALAKLKEPLPSEIKPLKIGRPVTLGQTSYIYGFVRFGGDNFGSWTNTIQNVQAGSVEYINNIMLGSATIQTGDSGSPTMDQEGNIVGVHWSAATDVNLTDPQILEWVESVIGKQTETVEPVKEPITEPTKDIVVKIPKPKPGQRIILEVGE